MKRIALPLRVASSTSSPSVSSSTPISRSVGSPCCSLSSAVSVKPKRTALLLAENTERRALDVAGHGHGHDHVLALDQILVLDSVGGGGKLAHPWGRELGCDLVELLAHHFIKAGTISQNFKQFSDVLGKT